MESLYFLIPLFFILIFVFPMTINLKLVFNLRTSMGIISLHLFKIRLLLILFKLKDNNIIIRKKNKEQELEFELSDKQKRFMEQLTIQLKNKVNVKRLISYTRIGTYDALETSIYNGIINSIFAIIFGYIKNLKPYARIDVLSYPAYNKELFLITLCGKVSISIFDLIYSVIMSSIITKRSEKYEAH